MRPTGRTLALVASPDTPAALLAGLLRADAARPLLTFYDDATGERVELSVATFDNWVAKTANLLQGDLSVGPGDLVGIALPAHWQAAVWVSACWAIGAAVLPGTWDDVAVAVIGPEQVRSAEKSTAGEVVALSLRPLGGRFVDPPPGRVLDYAVEVPAQGDRFSPYAPVGPKTVGWVEGGTTRTLADLVSAARSRAERLGLAAGERLLSTASPATYAGALDTLLVPLVLGGSVVLVRHPDPARHKRRLKEERVSTVLA